MEILINSILFFTGVLIGSTFLGKKESQLKREFEDKIIDTNSFYDNFICKQFKEINELKSIISKYRIKYLSKKNGNTKAKSHSEENNGK